MFTTDEILKEALAAFDFGAPIIEAVPYGCGHINDTFRVQTQTKEGLRKSFILQRMSSAAFHRPDQLMENIVGVTDYLGKKIREAGGNPDKEALQVIFPKNGKNYYTDSQGEAWRAHPFVEDTICYQSAETPELFETSARAFGKFQKMLHGYPAETLW